MLFGLRELAITDVKSAVLSQDATRQYAWMTLDHESAIKPAADAIHIESPSANTPAATIPPPKPKTKRTITPVSEATITTTGNGHATNGVSAAGSLPVNRPRRKASRRDTPGLIEQAEVLRTALRDALVKTNELLNAIKYERRQNRLVQSTLASLRELQKIAT